MTDRDQRFSLSTAELNIVLRQQGDGQKKKQKQQKQQKQQKVPYRPTDEDFQLSPEGIPDEQRKERLRELNEYLAYYRDRFLGYQVNQKLAHCAPDLMAFLDTHTNNVGDPFVNSNLATHTKWLERAVLDYYAELWGATPYDVKDKDSAWGYLLSMGASEGNVYALLNARDYLAGKYLMIDRPDIRLNQQGAVPKMYVAQAPTPKANAYTPVAFFSEDSHYSLAKAAHTLNIPTFGAYGQQHYPEGATQLGYREWPLEVPSYPSGAMNVEELVKFVEFFTEKGHPILILCNLGTTFKGAYDNVAEISQRLRPIFQKYCLVDRKVYYDLNDRSKYSVRNGYWIHVDGALGASYLPFLRMAQQQNKTTSIETIPQFDFSIPEVNSIVTSGHKYPGAPWACGVYMTKRKYQLEPPPFPAVIGSPDTTFAGSRNAFTAIVMWNFLAKYSYKDQINMIVNCQKLAEYAFHKLEQVEEIQMNNHHKPSIELARTPFSLAIRFRKPRDEIVQRYSLAHVPLRMSTTEIKDFCHIYLMPHVTFKKIDSLITELTAEDAFVPSRRYVRVSSDWGPASAERQVPVPIHSRDLA